MKTFIRARVSADQANVCLGGVTTVLESGESNRLRFGRSSYGERRNTEIREDSGIEVLAGASVCD